MPDNRKLIARLQGDIHKAVAPLVPPSGRFALLDFPDHPNVGDSAIWLGEIEYFRKLHALCPAYICSLDSASWDAFNAPSRKARSSCTVAGTSAISGPHISNSARTCSDAFGIAPSCSFLSRSISRAVTRWIGPPPSSGHIRISRSWCAIARAWLSPASILPARRNSARIWPFASARSRTPLRPRTLCFCSCAPTASGPWRMGRSRPFHPGRCRRTGWRTIPGSGVQSAVARRGN